MCLLIYLLATITHEWRLLYKPKMNGVKVKLSCNNMKYVFIEEVEKYSTLTNTNVLMSAYNYIIVWYKLHTIFCLYIWDCFPALHRMDVVLAQTVQWTSFAATQNLLSHSPTISWPPAISLQTPTSLLRGYFCHSLSCMLTVVYRDVED